MCTCRHVSHTPHTEKPNHANSNEHPWHPVLASKHPFCTKGLTPLEKLAIPNLGEKKQEVFRNQVFQCGCFPSSRKPVLQAMAISAKVCHRAGPLSSFYWMTARHGGAWECWIQSPSQKKRACISNVLPVLYLHIFKRKMEKESRPFSFSLITEKHPKISSKTSRWDLPKSWNIQVMLVEATQLTSTTHLSRIPGADLKAQCLNVWRNQGLKGRNAGV